MQPGNTILFLCPHGGAKSVIAASLFNRLAEQTGLEYVAVAAAAEDPYPAVPAPVVEFLAGEGLDVRTFQPRQTEEREVSSAEKVVAIGCDLAEGGLAGREIERWNDVPQASEDLDGSVAAIRRHVEALGEELRGRR